MQTNLQAGILKKGRLTQYRDTGGYNKVRRVHFPTIRLGQNVNKDKSRELNVLADNSDKTFSESMIVREMRG